MHRFKNSDGGNVNPAFSLCHSSANVRSSRQHCEWGLQSAMMSSRARTSAEAEGYRIERSLSRFLVAKGGFRRGLRMRNVIRRDPASVYSTQHTAAEGGRLPPRENAAVAWGRRSRRGCSLVPVHLPYYCTRWLHSKPDKRRRDALMIPCTSWTAFEHVGNPLRCKRGA